MGGSLRVDGVLRVRPWTAGIASSKERHQRARAQPREDQRDGRCLQAGDGVPPPAACAGTSGRRSRDAAHSGCGPLSRPPWDPGADASAGSALRPARGPGGLREPRKEAPYRPFSAVIALQGTFVARWPHRTAV